MTSKYRRQASEPYTPTMAPRRSVFVDLACTSHNAQWEKNHLLLFQASLEWFTKGTVNGHTSGEVKLGY